MEIWKDIVKLEGYYQVSNLGNVRSLDRVINYKDGRRPRLFKGKLLKPSKSKSGYRYYNFLIEGKSYAESIHRVVAKTFIECNTVNLEVNHKNENKEDNRVENLEWVTRKENCNYGTRVKRSSEKHRKPVKCLNTGKVYKMATDVKEDGFDPSNVLRVCKGRQTNHKGNKFIYIKGEC